MVNLTGVEMFHVDSSECQEEIEEEDTEGKGQGHQSQG